MHPPQDTHKPKNDHWGQARKTRAQIPQRHITIWGADASGQICITEGQPEQYHRTIGPYTLHQGMGKGNGNGMQLAQTCKQRKMTPMANWKRAKLTKQGKSQLKQRNDTARTKQHILHQHLTTWISPEGKTARQIDYIYG